MAPLVGAFFLVQPVSLLIYFADMAELFEYDPITGITSYTEEAGEGLITLHQEADIEAVRDHATRQRIDGVRDKGIKEGWWHYAYVPPIVMNQMRLHGIDPAKDTKAVFQFVNRFYPDLRTSEKWHDDFRPVRRGKLREST